MGWVLRYKYNGFPELIRCALYFTQREKQELIFADPVWKFWPGDNSRP
jgi:hypothetical protein